MNWRIWYSDGTTFSDRDGEPAEAPGLGVQVVVQIDHRTGRRTLCERDYYVWKEQQWFGVDLFGLWDYLSGPGRKVVKFGEYIDRLRFEDVLRLAEEDQDFPLRSGWLPGERRI